MLPEFVDGIVDKFVLSQYGINEKGSIPVRNNSEVFASSPSNTDYEYILTRDVTGQSDKKSEFGNRNSGPLKNFRNSEIGIPTP